MQGPEKNSYKEFDNEKKFLQLENSPPPPHNFSNGPSLSGLSVWNMRGEFMFRDENLSSPFSITS